MARKDSEKDSERPHYYSQFWLDVAAGRRIIGAPRPNEEGESAEAEIVEPVAPSRRVRSNDLSNGRSENIVHPVAEPLEPATDYADEGEDYPALSNTREDLAYPEDTDIPDMDLGGAAEDEEELYEDEDEDEDEEEEDDDMNWGRGRKKAKPTRTNKPVAKKPGKRDTRRGF